MSRKHNCPRCTKKMMRPGVLCHYCRREIKILEWMEKRQEMLLSKVEFDEGQRRKGSQR